MPQTNPVIHMLGRRLRLAAIGGGPGSFIGAMHRQAARLDDRFELVAAALSSDPDKSRAAGADLGLPADRSYGTAYALMEAEAMRADGADVVAIMTPNDSHHPYAMHALKLGFDVICDKPMANTLAQAQEVCAQVAHSQRVYCLTHNYTGYPLVRQAKAMVQAGHLGDIRLVQVEYVQGGRAKPGPSRTAWKDDVSRGGPSLVLGDIGTHAHNLLRFITGLEVEQVAAEVGTIVPTRQTHDYAGVLLRMQGGARGNLWVTQAAAGVENSLRIRVSGSLGTLEWAQESPQILSFKPLGAPAQTYTPNGPGTLPLAARSSRIASGHPEGFHEAFANLYADAAEAIAARRCGLAPDPLALYFPNATDGLLGVQFVTAVLQSSAQQGVWTTV
ncbi:Gfo/Idh/MocA family protein [Rhodoferax aquaticus]|uniref:Gfo/Idh/MocA family oxidoreductase n=1 Tax=Rhodoferax aquaticus TaxID=2527691 RepID=A0A515ESM2_9BURK|nr:Gfo/Idh/MocA family oxidoreductase [Rhodoferax aquaticus]QDL55661.1 Gfo/Idh/MocA family oxidoreductase [Rhodoferax aquaticus]